MTPGHKEEKVIIEHTIRLHTRKTIRLNLSLTYLNLSLFTCTLVRFIASYGVY